MDVMRVDTADGHHRFAMCTACYGYMGDLMHASEGLRWLGPTRYNLAGGLGVCRHQVLLLGAVPGSVWCAQDKASMAC